MARTDTETIIRTLREYAQRNALHGGNPYSARAYERAADTLAVLGQPLEPLIDEGRLQEIPGIGAAIADLVTRIYRSGTDKRLEEMRREFPSGVLELLSVPGLRADKVVKIYKTLGVDSLAALEEAARTDRIKNIKGLGASLQTKILNNLTIAQRGETRLHMHRAAALLERARARILTAQPSLKKLTIAGDLRRGCELVTDLSIVAQVPSAKSEAKEIKGSGLQLHLAAPRHFGAALLQATGSPAHIEQLAAFAQGTGMRLDAGGLWKGRRLVAGASEQAIYEKLGLQYIEPELREGADEIAKAAKNALPVLSGMPTCTAFFMHTPRHLTASIHSKRWRTRRASAATATSASPIIRSLRITQAGFQSRKSLSSTARLTD